MVLMQQLNEYKVKLVLPSAQSSRGLGDRMTRIVMIQHMFLIRIKYLSMYIKMIHTAIFSYFNIFE